MSFSYFDIQTNRALYLFRRAKKILLIGHKKPDSDTIGAIAAMAQFLEKFLAKNVVMAFEDVLPERFNFLISSDRAKKLSSLSFSEIDLIVALDCGSYAMTGLQNFFSSNPEISLINIDHHQGSFYGILNIVDSEAASTTEIIYQLFLKFSIPISSSMATALLCGIFGDTDSFKNPNTTEKTLLITSQLLTAGADLKAIIRNTLAVKSVSTLRLWGKALSQLKTNEKLGMVSTIITKSDIMESEADYSDLDGIANFLNSVPSASVSMVLSERGNEIKGSFRTLSKNTDVSKLAKLFGGGGHKKAAGFSMPGRLVKEGRRWRII